MDHSEHDLSFHCQMECSTKVAVGGRQKSESGQRNGEAVSSSPESGSFNGDGKRTAKTRRRRKRAANPESHQEVKTGVKVKGKEEPEQETGLPVSPCTALLGFQSEIASVWLDHSIYEQAEGHYQRWLSRSVSGSTQVLTDHPSARPAVSSLPLGQACLQPQAERSPVSKSEQPSIPNSLNLVSSANQPVAAPTPNEGYQSHALTPATPSQRVATSPINGLPRLSVWLEKPLYDRGLSRFSVELLREVWLEKPLYDRAEAAFYQHLYGNNNTLKWANAYTTPRGGDHHPQSLVEEEEEEEEEDDGKVVEGKRAVPQGKAEVFHALHPIQEEEEPAEVSEEREVAGACYFLHPDSERVWLEKWRYDAAESRLHCHCEDQVAAVMGARRPGAKASSLASRSPLRDNTMSTVDFFAQEKIWFEKPHYDEAERRFYEQKSGPSQSIQDAGPNSILQDIARARENIQKSLAGLKTTLSNRGSGQPVPNHQSQLSAGTGPGDQGELLSRVKSLELESQSLRKVVEDLRSALSKLESVVATLEKSSVAAAPSPAAPCTNGTSPRQQKSSAPQEDEDNDGDDDDLDLFGSDEDDVEAERIKEQRLKEYAEKKAKKPALIAKSSILLDVKPWDDETDMVKLEECVRTVQADGLLWGSSKLVPVGYGIRKLQISCVVEDDKVGTDMLEEEITKFEDYVQSVDIAAFNKI